MTMTGDRIHMRMLGSNPVIVAESRELGVVMDHSGLQSSPSFTLRHAAKRVLTVAEEDAAGGRVTMQAGAASDPCARLSILTGDSVRAMFDRCGTTLRSNMCVESNATVSGALYASRYVGLVDDYVTVSADRPPTAGALAVAVVSLSNQIWLNGVGNGIRIPLGGGGGDDENGTIQTSTLVCDDLIAGSIYPQSYRNLSASYRATDVDRPPSAFALSTAYSQLSNYVSASLSTLALVNGCRGCGEGDHSHSSNIAVSDGRWNVGMWLQSRDGADRTLYRPAGATVYSLPSEGVPGEPHPVCFSWTADSGERGLMSLSSNGDLSVRGAGGVRATHGVFDDLRFGGGCGDVSMRASYVLSSNALVLSSNVDFLPAASGQGCLGSVQKPWAEAHCAVVELVNGCHGCGEGDHSHSSNIAVSDGRWNVGMWLQSRDGADRTLYRPAGATVYSLPSEGVLGEPHPVCFSWTADSGERGLMSLSSNGDLSVRGAGGVRATHGVFDDLRFGGGCGDVSMRASYALSSNALVLSSNVDFLPAASGQGCLGSVQKPWAEAHCAVVELGSGVSNRSDGDRLRVDAGGRCGGASAGGNTSGRLVVTSSSGTVGEPVLTNDGWTPTLLSSGGYTVEQQIDRHRITRRADADGRIAIAHHVHGFAESRGAGICQPDPADGTRWCFFSGRTSTDGTPLRVMRDVHGQSTYDTVWVGGDDNSNAGPADASLLVKLRPDDSVEMVATVRNALIRSLIRIDRGMLAVNLMRSSDSYSLTTTIDIGNGVTSTMVFLDADANTIIAAVDALTGLPVWARGFTATLPGVGCVGLCTDDDESLGFSLGARRDAPECKSYDAFSGLPYDVAGLSNPDPVSSDNWTLCIKLRCANGAILWVTHVCQPLAIDCAMTADGTLFALVFADGAADASAWPPPPPPLKISGGATAFAGRPLLLPSPEGPLGRSNAIVCRLASDSGELQWAMPVNAALSSSSSSVLSSLLSLAVHSGHLLLSVVTEGCIAVYEAAYSSPLPQPFISRTIDDGTPAMVLIRIDAAFGRVASTVRLRCEGSRVRSHCVCVDAKRMTIGVCMWLPSQKADAGAFEVVDSTGETRGFQSEAAAAFLMRLTVSGAFLTSTFDHMYARMVFMGRSRRSAAGLQPHNDLKDPRVVDNALGRLRQVTGYTFGAGARSCGLIAKEVNAVLPEAVIVNPGMGALSVAYDNVLALVVQAIKELDAALRMLAQ